MATSITIQLLDYTLDDDFSKAKALCNEATEEINTLVEKCGKQFTDSQTKTIENVRIVIKNLITNQTKSAKVNATSTTPMFSQHIEATYFKKGEASSQNYEQKLITDQGMHGSIHKKKHDTNRQSDGPRGAQQIDASEENKKNQASKQASHALRLNNPDIADLSDTNRPTKIAEKFSELYDNEWTEAFESLSKTERSSEKRYIETLLNIVTDAYKFCRTEADRQIDNLQSNCIEVFKGEKLSSSRKYTDPSYGKGREYLVEYRKGIAQCSLQYLTEKFKSKMKIKYSDERIIAYIDKAVELTWWMAVQDPPVYMCPTSTNFDSNLYKPYTRSGKIPDFFVWPALQLYKDGGLLMKGVVQYKN